MGEFFEQRVGFNETTFREVNEDVRTDSDGRVAFRCECGRLGCNQLMDLSRAQYEAVRAHPRRFAVLIGHELREAENVVERHDHYLVVEKHGKAGAIAERNDPRHRANG